MKHEHRIYIWSRQYGQLVKILEGPKEGIMDLIVRFMHFNFALHDTGYTDNLHALVAPHQTYYLLMQYQWPSICVEYAGSRGMVGVCTRLRRIGRK